MSEELSKPKSELAERGGSFLSKRLAVLGGGTFFGPDLLEKLVGLGLNPNQAFWGIMVSVCVFILSDTIIAYRKEGVKGLLERLKLEAEFLRLKDKAPSETA